MHNALFFQYVETLQDLLGEMKRSRVRYGTESEDFISTKCRKTGLIMFFIIVLC